jgi:Bacteriophage tail sheath protein
MPPTLTYPGVYIQEVASGVHAIASVSTADTAFVDCFRSGPMNQAVRITSLAEFQRVFGGLDTTSEASYAVQQYFLNGGSVAWIVRVSRDPQPLAASFTLRGGSPLENTLTVQAANPGTWGNALQVAAVPGSTADVFNLIVRQVVMANGQPVLGSNGLPQVLATETHRNLSMSPTNSRYAVTIVGADSQLVDLLDAGVGVLPSTTPLTPRGDVPESAFQRLAGGSDALPPDSAALRGDPNLRTGMYALDRIEPFNFNVLCMPAAANLDPAAANLDTPNLRAVFSEAEAYCEPHRAFLIVDPPPYVNTQVEMNSWMATNDAIRHPNAAVYFPRLVIADPANGGRPREVAASGTLAGVYARSDGSRGVWKAPAGTDATLRNATLAVTLTDGENGALNPLGINALRNFAVFGNISWGARTLVGADQQASEWKYIPVRRTALFIETSLYEGLKWVVFEPNDEPLWAQIRLNVGAFMHNLFIQSAFQGKTPAEAYFVKCDKDTTTQNDIDRGIVNVVVGFAPLKPAEFVIIAIQQMAGQVQAA